MTEIAKNTNLHKAKDSKKDEFYTQLGDIERELRYYKSHFKDKVVYCNCDDPRVSNFFHFFSCMPMQADNGTTVKLTITTPIGGS